MESLVRRRFVESFIAVFNIAGNASEVLYIAA